MNNREENKRAYTIRRRRRSITWSILAGILLVALVLTILSLPPIRERFMWEWLRARWGYVLAIAVIFGIGIIGTLPVLLEANFNPRVLSSPGHNPELRY